jgi:hypothetical protein
MHVKPDIPATVFTRDHATKAVDLAEKIFEITETFLTDSDVL